MALETVVKGFVGEDMDYGENRNENSPHSSKFSMLRNENRKISAKVSKHSNKVGIAQPFMYSDRNCMS